MTYINSYELSDFLQVNDIFSSLAVSVHEIILNKANYFTASGNQILFSEGDEASHVYFLLAGIVSIEKYSENGHITVLATLSAGNLFGHFGAIDKYPRSATARAIKAANIASIPANLFQTLCEEHRSVEQALFKRLIKIIRLNNDSIEELAHMSLKQRIINLIARMALQNNEISNGIEIKITQARLAEIVSASREKVNGCLRQLEKDEIIKRGHRKLIITDSKKIWQLARQSIIYD